MYSIYSIYIYTLYNIYIYMYIIHIIYMVYSVYYILYVLYTIYYIRFVIYTSGSVACSAPSSGGCHALRVPLAWHPHMVARATGGLTTAAGFLVVGHSRDRSCLTVLAGFASQGDRREPAFFGPAALPIALDAHCNDETRIMSVLLLSQGRCWQRYHPSSVWAVGRREA